MTTIQWTNETWNPTSGCTRVSEGCRNCYIDRTPPFRMHGRFFHNGSTGILIHRNRFHVPIEWKKPRMIFVNSLSDLFHEDIDDETILEVFTVMAIAKQHTFQVLTKRPKRMQAFLEKYDVEDIYLYWHAFSGAPREAQDWPLPNLWLGVSVEDQKTADERIPILLQTQAAVRWISAEPLLGPIDLYRGGFSFLERLKSPSGTQYEKLDWIVVGGESGPKARRTNLSHLRSIVKQGRTWGVPVFVKQLGRTPFELCGTFNQCNFVHVLKDKKGGDPSEWPEDLQVREFPAAQFTSTKETR